MITLATPYNWVVDYNNWNHNFGGTHLLAHPMHNQNSWIGDHIQNDIRHYDMSNMDSYVKGIYYAGVPVNFAKDRYHKEGQGFGL